MADRPHLPTRQNPLLQPENTPLHEILEERRCHAQTKLAVAPGQVNTSNATKAENLIEKFDYVHLRCPLPKDLTGSGVFAPTNAQPVPETYYLMRRSSDGYISATGMFKAAFPWASKLDEQKERDYLKSLPDSDQQEIAGNVWVTSETALDLASEYSITDWIIALLSNEPIELYSLPGGQKKITSGPRPIASPPQFVMPPKFPISSQAATGNTTTRKQRASSPVKAAAPAPTPNRPKKTPRKPRGAAAKKSGLSTRGSRSLEATPEVADSVADSMDERDVGADASGAEGEADGQADGKTNAHADAHYDAEHKAEAEAEAEAEALAEAEAEALAIMDEEDAEPLGDDKVRVSLTEEVQDDGATQTTRHTVKVELSPTSPEIALPTDTEGIVSMAKEIVENVKGMQAIEQRKSSGTHKSSGRTKSSGPAPSTATSNPKKSLKRGRDEFEEDLELLDGPEELVEEIVHGAAAERAQDEGRPAKRVRLMVPVEDFRREKVMKRALAGLCGSLAFGLLIPAISTYWGA